LRTGGGIGPGNGSFLNFRGLFRPNAEEAIARLAGLAGEARFERFEDLTGADHVADGDLKAKSLFGFGGQGVIFTIDVNKSPCARPRIGEPQKARGVADKVLFEIALGMVFGGVDGAEEFWKSSAHSASKAMYLP